MKEVIKDMEERNQFGIEKYGTPLMTFNGRNALKDAYQEAMDLCVYLKQEIMERGQAMIAIYIIGMILFIGLCMIICDCFNDNNRYG